MPFNIAGDWVPEEMPPKKNKHPVKVIKEKRGKALLTCILNLPLDSEKLKQLCSKLKQQLGCGGAVKDDRIELQGDQIQKTIELLLKEGIKISLKK